MISVKIAKQGASSFMETILRELYICNEKNGKVNFSNDEYDEQQMRAFEFFSRENNYIIDFVECCSNFSLLCFTSFLLFHDNIQLKTISFFFFSSRN